MYTHGGARPGSGRKKGGIAQARRLLSDAIQQGLAIAGRKKYPDRVSQDDIEMAAVQTGAMLVDDMIQAGQGNDVMKLWATVALKETDGDKSESGKSTLAEALSTLPVADHVRDVSCLGRTLPGDPQPEGGATHIERDAPRKQPYFSPQNRLPFDAEEDQTR